ncbi:MGDG synthase family glycosyltransferase [Pelomicrobium methylotrophicum]|uniref:MGDG synthase family glycosyltransferase n=1 Tax=Pelomicrobium methylotrophicum TaxID=2602750 RepID=UPI001969E513|nr:glycosyltransferase [Pelomicrobium methylotrophicum]
MNTGRLALKTALSGIARRWLPAPALGRLVRDGGARRPAPRLMLLTSTLGSGHLRAAQAVEAAFLELSPGSEVLTLDFWSLMDEGVAQAVRQAYLRLVHERPELYDRIFQLEERTWRRILESDESLPPSLAEGIEFLTAAGIGKTLPSPDGGRYAPVDRILFRLFCAAFREPARMGGVSRVRARNALIAWGWTHLAWRLYARLLAFRPDVVVATQMIPAALLSFVKIRRGLALPAVGVLTDFGMHDFWLQPGIDCHCVAHESIAGAGNASGEVARVSATGIPLMPGFRNPPDVREARSRLRLDPDAPVALVLGGGLGLGVDAIAERVLACPGRLQVLVLAGHNVAARNMLAPLIGRCPGRLYVWDWTEQMEVFFRAADVVVGKPGGLTVAEALACGRPLLATRSLRGQEGFNVRFLERHGVGALVPEEALAQRLRALLANRAELARIQQRAWALGKRDGAARVAELALELARSPSYDQAMQRR